jgi:hypothetical protein
MQVIQLDPIKYYRIIDDNNFIDLLMNQDEDNVIFIFKNGNPLDVRHWDFYIDIFNNNKN